MKRKLIIISTVLFSFMTFMSGADMILAQEDANLENAKDVTEKQPLSEEELIRQAKAKVKSDFLGMLQREMSAARRDLYEVKANTGDAEVRLSETREKIATLSDQLANLDRLKRETEEKIKNVSVQINLKENELMLLYSDLDLKNVAIANQKEMLSEYLQVLYERESTITDTMNENEDINIAKMLLSDVPVSEQLQLIKYFNILEEQGHEIFNELDELLNEVKAQKVYAEIQRVKLTELYNKLEIEKHNLEVQTEAKVTLLAETRGDEEIYQQLFEESKRQQEQILQDMLELRDHLAFIQQRIAADGDSFNAQNYSSIISGDKVSVYEYINDTEGDIADFNLAWPMEPSRGISAYFRDSGYASRFGIPHNAIDIPAPQDSIVRAPADGVVYKVRDNGMGYSYLTIAHRGGFMTTYGHVSVFLVAEGEKVFAGQPIILSGGTPGTAGAGLLTTGAHLHFEVMQGGKYVDPLLYVPLNKLDESYIPSKYKEVVDLLNKIEEVEKQPIDEVGMDRIGEDSTAGMGDYAVPEPVQSEV